MEPYPLTFEPILVEKVWGGRTLEKFGKKLPPEKLIGESWELADLPPSVRNGKSIIANGSRAGEQLDEQFPLLIKFLDACDNLSVQVHPSEAYAKTHQDAHLKSEAWVILNSTPEGTIYVGLKEGTTEAMLRKSIENNSVPDLLNAINVKKGECYYLPSGTCHALGAGVLVAEVQTPSDTTFRLWDWGRTGRTMHVNQAIECIDFNSINKQKSTSIPMQCGPFETTLLVETPHFSAERMTALDDASMDLIVDETPAVLMVIEGHAAIKHDICVDAPMGTTVLLPVDLKNA
ncbi:MAG: class I mannose-6-phosphate isomerase, partial [Phycisphaerales bacterium]|nr:class I mannose-6-phosphate isomerase [Phycisphaerales bacterium]